MISRYLLERRAMKSAPAKTGKEKSEGKKAKKEFYTQHEAPPDLVGKEKICHCENCNRNLGATMAINPSAVICHILPKRKDCGCPSVALHKNNKWFGCGDCHTDYDNKGAAYVQNMSIFEVLKARVATFYHLIPQNEIGNVPEYFKPKTNGKSKPRGKGGKFAKKGK